jgi:predicted O-methyltransferase YrrM
VGDHERWAAVDDYITGLLLAEDDGLDAALAHSRSAGLPDIGVSAAQGKLLQLLVRALGARRILEVGTLGGYSAIWMARALPADGTLVTLEVSEDHARVARENVDRAGVGDRVEIHQGPALQTLPTLSGPFDLFFIDADKQSNADYLQWAVRLSRPGSVIVVDNEIRAGLVTDADSSDPAVLGTRRLTEALAAEPRLSATEIQTVGSKGYDGFALAVVLP